MLLYYALSTLHVIVCIILVLVVLLQSGKGADLAGAFGGGATQTAFGSRGPASFLSKMTTIAAIVFMLTSISLSLISTRTTKADAKSILETGQKAKPVRSTPAPAKAPVAAPSPEQIQKRVEELQKQRQESNNKTTPAPAPAPAQQKPSK